MLEKRLNLTAKDRIQSVQNTLYQKAGVALTVIGACIEDLGALSKRGVVLLYYLVS